MDADTGWWLLFAGFGGFGLGVGLVAATFVVRVLKDYIRMNGDDGKR